MAKAKTDEDWMGRALKLADQAAEDGEVPVGAVIVKDGMVVGEGWNRSIGNRDPSAHAEIIAMRDAGGLLGNYRLSDCELYVTLEPCIMCAGAMIHARIKRLIYGAADPKTGAAGSVFDILSSDKHNHSVDVTGGVMAEEAAEKLQAFFRERR